MTRRATILAAIAALSAIALPAPVAIARRAPEGFIGMVPQGNTSEQDYELMHTSGIKSVRLPMYWWGIQSGNPLVRNPDFDGFDHEVKLAAEHGLRVFPFVWGTPGWAASQLTTMPTETPWQRWAWTSFLRRAADRYGPFGSFWVENPEVPYLPIRDWEIWNEANIVTFSDSTDPLRYATLLRISGRVLHRIDPGSKVIIGGLFGRPLQIPPNTSSGDFLSRLYRSGDIKRYFDGVALHPYVSAAGAMKGEILNLRRVERVHHDSRTPIYVTEMGWGSDSNESRWERGLHGQARELNEAMSLLVSHRRSWRIGGVWWFSWHDLYDSCQFCDSAGLLNVDREAKPAWYAFNEWTGGEADTVPRASF
jgi:hypothetical protein